MSDLLNLVTEVYEALNRGDFETAEKYFAEDVQTVTPGGTMHSRDEWRVFGDAFHGAAPDMHHEIVSTFEDGDTIVVEGVYSGTQTEPLATPDGILPASGKAFAFPYVDILQVRDGMCVSHRIYWDNVTFMSQIGALSG